jgi:hypothetical protein
MAETAPARLCGTPPHPRLATMRQGQLFLVRRLVSGSALPRHVFQIISYRHQLQTCDLILVMVYAYNIMLPW